MTTSFPYFAAARQVGVLYAEVLAIAATMDKLGGPYDAIFEKGAYAVVEQVWIDGQARRSKVASTMDLREHVALCNDFSPKERNLILELLRGADLLEKAMTS
jgi:hypothetical protein